MSITQQPTHPEVEEGPVSAEYLDYIDSTPEEVLMNDAQFRQSLRELSQPVASENACDDDEPRESTPVPMEDLIYFKALHQATSLKELASIVASSYAARDVYELHKPTFIWRVLTRSIGRDGINNLLMCVYLEGECSYFNPGNCKELDYSMLEWAAGNFSWPAAYIHDDAVVGRMLSLFLDMVTIVNRFLTQMYCEKSLWEEGHHSALFDMYRRIGFRPT